MYVLNLLISYWYILVIDISSKHISNDIIPHLHNCSLFNVTSPGDKIAMKPGANFLLTRGVQLCTDCCGKSANTSVMMCLHM